MSLNICNVYCKMFPKWFHRVFSKTSQKYPTHPSFSSNKLEKIMRNLWGNWFSKFLFLTICGTAFSQAVTQGLPSTPRFYHGHPKVEKPSVSHVRKRDFSKCEISALLHSLISCCVEFHNLISVCDTGVYNQGKILSFWGIFCENPREMAVE